MVLVHCAAKYAMCTDIFLLMQMKHFVAFQLLFVTFQLLLCCCLCQSCQNWCFMQQEAQQLTVDAA